MLAAFTPPNPTPPHPRGSGENPETKTFITWKHTNSSDYQLLSIDCRVALCFPYI